MSQNFKIQFEENRESVSENLTHETVDRYSAPSNTRNVAFRWADGRIKFYNYSYLVTCEYLPDDGKIILEFASEIVELTGTRLAALADLLLDHTPRIIEAKDERYTSLDDTDTWFVTTITLKTKEG